VADTNQIAKLPGTKSVAAGTAVIGSGVVPSPSSDYAVPVWLAYASRCYYQAALPRVKPIWRLDSEEAYEQYFVTANAVYYQPDAIKTIAYMNSGSVPFLDDAGMMSEIKLPTPYDRGFTNAVFSVDEFTNVQANLVLPKAFHTVLYSPKGDAKSSSELQMIHSYQGWLESASSGEIDGNFQPVLPGKVWITDYRIPAGKNSGPRRYQITRLLRDEVKREKAKMSSGSKRFIVISFMLLVGGIACFPLFRSKQNKTNHES
jgi:hypothetical protein